MRTRSVPIPVLPRDDDDALVVDVDDVPIVRETTIIGLGGRRADYPGAPIPIPIGNQVTQDLDTTLRHPAECRFFIRAGFEAGAPTDLIADSISQGHKWEIGPSWAARNYLVAVSLSDPAVPFERRMLAWRVPATTSPVLP